MSLRKAETQVQNSNTANSGRAPSEPSVRLIHSRGSKNRLQSLVKIQLTGLVNFELTKTPGTWFDTFARTGAREISHRSPQVVGLGAFLFA
jgi:hypothetical protein